MAAACGLLIGIGAGRLMGPMPSAAVASWQKASVSAVTGAAGRVQQSDEQMLVEIDAALARSRTKEFRALDELTPRVADAHARARR